MWDMKFSSLLRTAFGLVLAVFLAGGSSVAFSGCSTRGLLGSTPKYWRIVSADFEGNWISEWVAEGDVKTVDGGYRFAAVQRRIFKPEQLEFHYPLGYPVTVAAPNVIVTPTTKPLWLSKVDGTPGPEELLTVVPPTRQPRVKPSAGY